MNIDGSNNNINNKKFRMKPLFQIINLDEKNGGTQFKYYNLINAKYY